MVSQLVLNKVNLLRHFGLWKFYRVQRQHFSGFSCLSPCRLLSPILSRANHPDAIVYNQDTNICLENAINAREGKDYEPLRGIADGKQLPSMPQRGEVELITGGFPCQSFSGMNHQRHKSHEDIRYPMPTLLATASDNNTELH